jgi:hypothetical protein
MKQQTPLKRRYTSTRPHGATSQKTVICILPGVGTWNLTKLTVRSASQEIPRLLFNSKVIYRVQRARHQSLTTARRIQSTPPTLVPSTFQNATIGYMKQFCPLFCSVRVLVSYREGKKQMTSFWKENVQRNIRTHEGLTGWEIEDITLL